MLVMVLKSFPYAADGMSTRQLHQGAAEDIRNDLVDGLKAEGFIGDLPAPKPKAVPPSRPARVGKR